MANVRWCLKCKEELGGESAASLFGLGTGNYCKNPKCSRYGLVSLIYLEEKKKAPEEMVSNDVTGEDNVPE